MEMLLMGAVLALFGLAVSCAAFGAATRDEGPVQTEGIRAAVPETRFFAAMPAETIPEYKGVPIEALLLQIENHIRLEHAAAQSFVAAPSPSMLQSRTISRLVN